MKIVKNVRPPSGVSRALFRAPIYLYRLGLGWLFGKRILLLHHIGRVSGTARQVVFEVVEHDPTDGSFVVASGWGPTAAWYRNILHTPQVSIQVGRRTIPVTAIPHRRGRRRDLRPIRCPTPRRGDMPAPLVDGILRRRVAGRLPRGWATNAVRPVDGPGLTMSVYDPGGPPRHRRCQRLVSATFQAPPTSLSGRWKGLMA